MSLRRRSGRRPRSARRRRPSRDIFKFRKFSNNAQCKIHNAQLARKILHFAFCILYWLQHSESRANRLHSSTRYRSRVLFFPLRERYELFGRKFGKAKTVSYDRPLRTLKKRRAKRRSVYANVRSAEGLSSGRMSRRRERRQLQRIVVLENRHPNRAEVDKRSR